MDSSSDSTDDSDAVWQTVADNKTTKRRQVRSPEVVKHKSKLSKNTNNDEIPSTSNNMFGALAVENNDDNNDDDDNVNNEPSEAKPPPIIIPNVSDIKAMINNFSKIVTSEDYSYKSLRDGQVRVMTKNVKAYRDIVKYLDDKKINFHTYQLKQERAYRVVVKNLHFSTPISAIKDEIQSLGHQVRNVMNIKSRVSKQPMSMFFVDLEPNLNNKQIYEIKHLFNAIVKIEPPIKTKEIIQCYRCQQFGHSKTYCRKLYNCVKCGLNHPTDNCPKPENTPPQCVNCLKHHTANYKGCRIYRELLKKKYMYRRHNMNFAEKSNPFNSENFPNFNNNNTNNNSFEENQYSYAQVARNNNNNNQEQNILKNFELFMKKQNELTNKLLSMMQLIITKLCV